MKAQRMNPVTRPFYQMYAFFRLDAKNTSSYKLNFTFSIVTMFSWAITSGILGTLTQSSLGPYIAQYGAQNAATFMMLGMMINTFLQVSQGAPMWIASPGQLERIILTPCPIPVFVLGRMGWNYFWNILSLGAFFITGTVLFGMNLVTVDWLTFLAVLIVGILAMWGIGIISAAVQLVTKRWDPISWILQTFSFMISGVFYPPSALNVVDPSGTLHTMAWFLPHTYVYHMVRLAFGGYHLTDPEIMTPFLKLSLISIVLFVIGLFAFRLCLRRCQLEGSLGWI
jgi:ABC-type polysaccharide/polyol phosphate export permease